MGYVILGVFGVMLITWLVRGFRIRDVSTIDGDESRDGHRIGWGGWRER